MSNISRLKTLAIKCQEHTQQSLSIFICKASKYHTQILVKNSLLSLLQVFSNDWFWSSSGLPSFTVFRVNEGERKGEINEKRHMLSMLFQVLLTLFVEFFSFFPRFWPNSSYSTEDCLPAPSLCASISLILLLHWLLVCSYKNYCCGHSSLDSSELSISSLHRPRASISCVQYYIQWVSQCVLFLCILPLSGMRH